jgi:hypothetical protein
LSMYSTDGDAVTEKYYLACKDLWISTTCICFYHFDNNFSFICIIQNYWYVA